MEEEDEKNRQVEREAEQSGGKMTREEMEREGGGEQYRTQCKEVSEVRPYLTQTGCCLNLNDLLKSR